MKPEELNEPTLVEVVTGREVKRGAVSYAGREVKRGAETYVGLEVNRGVASYAGREVKRGADTYVGLEVKRGEATAGVEKEDEEEPIDDRALWIEGCSWASTSVTT